MRFLACLLSVALLLTLALPAHAFRFARRAAVQVNVVNGGVADSRSPGDRGFQGVPVGRGFGVGNPFRFNHQNQAGFRFYGNRGLGYGLGAGYGSAGYALGSGYGGGYQASYDPTLGLGYGGAYGAGYGSGYGAGYGAPLTYGSYGAGANPCGGAGAPLAYGAYGAGSNPCGGAARLGAPTPLSAQAAQLYRSITTTTTTVHGPAGSIGR